jgi:hypothetical protein
MSYWDPSLGRIARLETKVQEKKFGEYQTFLQFIAMQNSNALSLRPSIYTPESGNGSGTSSL